MKCKNILAIGAHPDDVEYGCLGFLLSNMEDTKINIYVASVGSRGDDTSGEIRIEETNKALAILNPERIEVRNKKGIIDENFPEILADLERLIKETNPDLILTHGPHDTHQEHKLIHTITLAAARRKKLNMLRYSIVSNTSFFQPNFFYEFSAEILEKKARQLAFHKSQSDKAYMAHDFLKSYHQRPYSFLHGIKYCEAFEVDRIMI